MGKVHHLKNIILAKMLWNPSHRLHGGSILLMILKTENTLDLSKQLFTTVASSSGVEKIFFNMFFRKEKASNMVTAHKHFN